MGERAVRPGGPARCRTARSILGRGWWIVLALMVVTGSAIGAVAYGVADDQTDSKVTFGTVEVGAPAALSATAFRVVYRVDDTAGPDERVSTETVVYRLPGEARIERRDGPPPGGPVRSETVMNRTHTFVSDRASQRREFGFSRAPAPLTDSFSRAALDDAVKAGRALALGEAEVAGERCLRYAYRSGGAAPLALPVDGERVDVCVSGDGILVQEAVTVVGRVVLRRDAVTVERSPALEGDVFLDKRRPGGHGSKEIDQAAENLASPRVLKEGAAPGDTKVFSVGLPRGFREWRRATVGVVGEGLPSWFFYVRAFERGPELVLVEQAIRDARWTKAEADTVDLGQGRSADVVYHPSDVEVRVSLDHVLLRVRAPRAELALAVARSLHR